MGPHRTGAGERDCCGSCRRPEVDRLETFAELGAPLSSIANVEEDYRFLVSGSYMIFYRVMGSDVYADRILYGRRDYLSVLLK